MKERTFWILVLMTTCALWYAAYKSSFKNRCPPQHWKLDNGKCEPYTELEKKIEDYVEKKKR